MNNRQDTHGDVLLPAAPGGGIMPPPFTSSTRTRIMDIRDDAQRFSLTHLDTADEPDDGADVVAGLRATPKTLPCKYFYDAVGSELFERICATEAYYPTRTERAILQGHADDIAAATGPVELVELGSGSAVKTRVLLRAYSAAHDEVHFAPIDVSGTMLEASSRRLVDRFDELTIRGIAGTYEAALDALHPAPAPHRLFLFLGSTIGNFDVAARTDFIARIHDAMAPGDFFLLGFDRIKDRAVLEEAYNDKEGVTAAFNLNILAHLNARFHGDFRPARFRHVAFFNDELSRIEMHLESREAQEVHLADLNLTATFGAGERIHTEISTKFSPDTLSAELANHGFTLVTNWSDPQQWFSLMLLKRA